MIDKVSKPIMLIFNVSPLVAFIEKLPSKSVSVLALDVVPKTMAPGIPIPSLSNTLPLITCPDIYAGSNMSAKKLKIKFLMN